MSRALRVAPRLILAAAVAVSSYIHADLYVAHGYRHIHVVGPAFLLQASAGFAIALLLVVTSAPIIRLNALGVVLGALAGFLASRTIGVFGFVEHGFTPAPQAAVSVIVEIGALLTLATWQWRITTESQARRRSLHSAAAVTLNATTRPAVVPRERRATRTRTGGQ